MRHRDTRSRHSVTGAVSLRPFHCVGTISLALLAVTLTGRAALGQVLAMSNPKDLLTTDPDAFTELIETARPTALSADAKTVILKTLPREGEITALNASHRQKLAALLPVLRAAQRDAVYEIKIVDVPQAAIGIYARAVILISQTALELLDATELQAAVAHEAAHEYVWEERERAAQRGDKRQLKNAELICDAIAIVTLHRLGIQASPLLSGFDKIMRFNRSQLGTAINEKNYPSLEERRAFARDVTAWILGASGTVVRAPAR
jgi:hypothetical protein